MSMDAAERVLLAETVNAALAGRASDADAVLADLGWLELLAAEPRDAIGVVFEALGMANATTTALDDVVVSALGADPRPDRAVLLPSFGRWDPPGRIDGGLVHAAGLATARVATASELVVVCAAGSDLRAAIVPVSAATLRVVQGIDPDARVRVVQLDGAATTATLDGAGWDAAVALGRRAVAHQMAGGCRTMLDLARTHALERVQFGRPVASFQAVRHRLAEALVAVEALDATLGAAGDEPNPLTAALAKVTAGRSARTIATHCQQVLAGIGFTTDHPFHRLLKRSMLLEGLFGSADELAADIGRQLLAARRVPTLVEL